MLILDALMPYQMEAHCSAKNLLVLHVSKTDNCKANTTTTIYSYSSSEPNFFYLVNDLTILILTTLSSFSNVHNTTFQSAPNK